ncbi:MAG TPA: hypothetical protein VFQ07_09115 [Candidatus Polarisedimenticolia bacterium]|nr:hypothetical protein [Candidatus Polarisedimenticolia bacterium]
MQFLRADDHHLDSCWMTWNSPATRLKFTTIPMIHVADPSYYERVMTDLARCRYALVEGVSWRLGDEKHPLYDLCARNLGLVAQERALKLPPGVAKINIDMKRSEFRERLFALPWRWVLAVVLLRRILWLLTLPKAWRPEAMRMILRTRKRSERAATPMGRLILTGRDRRIVENLEAFHRERGPIAEPQYAAIVFGAAHMPAICEALGRLGFQPGSRRWVEVLRVPAEGRARA